MRHAILIVMTYIATITSRGQLTIPSDLFRKTSLKRGSKVIFSVDGDQVKLQPALDLIDNLVGSVTLQPRFRGKNLERVIKEAKTGHFKKIGLMK